MNLIVCPILLDKRMYITYTKKMSPGSDTNQKNFLPWARMVVAEVDNLHSRRHMAYK